MCGVLLVCVFHGGLLFLAGAPHLPGHILRLVHYLLLEDTDMTAGGGIPATTLLGGGSLPSLAPLCWRFTYLVVVVVKAAHPQLRLLLCNARSHVGSLHCDH